MHTAVRTTEMRVAAAISLCTSADTASMVKASAPRSVGGARAALLLLLALLAVMLLPHAHVLAQSAAATAEPESGSHGIVVDSPAAATAAAADDSSAVPLTASIHSAQAKDEEQEPEDFEPTFVFTPTEDTTASTLQEHSDATGPLEEPAAAASAVAAHTPLAPSDAEVSAPAASARATSAASPRPFDSAWPASRKASMRDRVRTMFDHAFDSYMQHAFPHDELKPLSVARGQSWTNSLAELGNAHESDPRTAAAGAAGTAQQSPLHPDASSSLRADPSKPYTGFALTLIDSLSTLAVMGERERFCQALHWLDAYLSFDVDVRVHLFELNIRVLGGLLSAHLLVTDPERGPALTHDVSFVPLSRYSNQPAPGEPIKFVYRGGMLRLATDLGERMLRAFTPPLSGDAAHAASTEAAAKTQTDAAATKAAPASASSAATSTPASSTPAAATSPSPPLVSPLPYSFVHLQAGVLNGETEETCAAGAGTLILEWATLSALTGDDRFYRAADGALQALWGIRYPGTNLFPSTFSRTGTTIDSVTGIGAGVDSLYEYLMKASIFLDNKRYLDMFEQALSAAELHLKISVIYPANATNYFDSNRCEYGARSLHPHSPPSLQRCDATITRDWYLASQASSGAHAHHQFESLQAFWPGLLVLAGRVDEARHAFASFFSVWEEFSALPERYNFLSGALHGQMKYYPLRPELAESAYMLSQATKDDLYFDAAARMIEDLDTHARTPHGFASIASCDPKDKHPSTPGGKGSGALQLQDRQESFFLAETLKYLYLTFEDEDHWMHSSPSGNRAEGRASSWIFSTEGHLFPVRADIQRKFSDERMVYDVVPVSPLATDEQLEDAYGGATARDLMAWDAKRRFDTRAAKVGRDTVVKELLLAPAHDPSAQLLNSILATGGALDTPGSKTSVAPERNPDKAPHPLAHLFRFREGFFHPELVAKSLDPMEYQRDVRYYHARALGEETARGGTEHAALSLIAPIGTPFTGGFERAELGEAISVRDALHMPQAERGGLNLLTCPVHSHSRGVAWMSPPMSFFAYDRDVVRFVLKQKMDAARVQAYELWKLQRQKHALVKAAAVAANAAATAAAPSASSASAKPAAAATPSSGTRAAPFTHVLDATALENGFITMPDGQRVNLPEEVLKLLKQQAASAQSAAHPQQHPAHAKMPHMSSPIGPITPPPPRGGMASPSASQGASPHDLDAPGPEPLPPPALRMGDFSVEQDHGAFHVHHHPSGSSLTIRNLATELVELVNEMPEPGVDLTAAQFATGGDAQTTVPTRVQMLAIDGEETYVHAYYVDVESPLCSGVIPAAPGHYGTLLPPASAIHGSGRRAAMAQSFRASEEEVAALDGFSILHTLGEAKRSEPARLSAYVVAAPSDGCAPFPLSVAPSLRNHFVLVERGGCTFMDKALHLADAGAVGMIVWNRLQPNFLFAMGHDGSEHDVAFPALMVDEAGGMFMSRCLAIIKERGEEGTRADPLRPRMAVSMRRETVELGTPLEVRPTPVMPTDSAASSSRASDSAPSVRVTLSGTADHFVFRTMAGWTASVDWNEDAQNYQLKLSPVGVDAGA